MFAMREHGAGDVLHAIECIAPPDAADDVPLRLRLSVTGCALPALISGEVAVRARGDGYAACIEGGPLPIVVPFRPQEPFLTVAQRLLSALITAQAAYPSSAPTEQSEAV